MQEAFSYFVGLLVALWVTFMVAFPDLLLPQLGGKRKKFSGRHWGAYEGSPELNSQDVKPADTIEVGIPAKKIKYVVGSTTYAGGRSK